METGDEVSVDLERAKTIIVLLATICDVYEDGTRTMYFELNGQPRSLGRKETSR